MRIAVVGKYVDLADSYKCLNEALVHGGIANECRVELDARRLREDRAGGLPESVAHRRRHPGADGLRPARHRGQDRGGALRAREARSRSSASASACRWRSSSSRATSAASSAPTRPRSTRRRRIPVIDLMPEQRGLTQKGGTMRLGAYPCVLAEGSLARKLYGKSKISRAPPPSLRVQQRLPRAARERGPASAPGVSPDGGLVEMVELARPPVVPRLPVPPRVQVAPDRLPSAVQGLHPRRARSTRRARDAKRRCCGGLKVVKR